MTLILDAGAFVALERGDRAMWLRLEHARRAGIELVTHAAIVGQVWRGGGRQARLATALRAVDVVGVDAALGRAAGVLLARAGSSDVVDAALVLLARNGDEIVTSDPDDIEVLADAADLDIEIVST